MKAWLLTKYVEFLSDKRIYLASYYPRPKYFNLTHSGLSLTLRTVGVIPTEVSYACLFHYFFWSEVHSQNLSFYIYSEPFLYSKSAVTEINRDKEWADEHTICCYWIISAFSSFAWGTCYALHSKIFVSLSFMIAWIITLVFEIVWAREHGGMYVWPRASLKRICILSNQLSHSTDPEQP